MRRGTLSTGIRENRIMRILRLILFLIGGLTICGLSAVIGAPVGGRVGQIVGFGLGAGAMSVILNYAIRQYREPRFPAWRCQQCGYDIRRSGPRCPECGFMPDKAKLTPRGLSS